MAHQRTVYSLFKILETSPEKLLSTFYEAVAADSGNEVTLLHIRHDDLGAGFWDAQFIAEPRIDLEALLRGFPKLVQVMVGAAFGKAELLVGKAAQSGSCALVAAHVGITIAADVDRAEGSAAIDFSTIH